MSRLCTFFYDKGSDSVKDVGKNSTFQEIKVNFIATSVKN